MTESKKILPTIMKALPIVLILGAGVALFYFLWYKPRKDEEDAENAAAQAAYDKKLLNDGMLNPKYQNVAVPVTSVLGTQGATATL